MRVAIIGCGSIGNKRAKALNGHSLVACADTLLARAQQLASQHRDCIATSNWHEAIEKSDVVIVSTTNDMLVPVALLAAKSGKHVLIEKPAARTSAELRTLLDVANQAKVVVKVGFNHRFHPAVLKARHLIDEGALGPLMFLRARYGHGGRLGMEKEWRGSAPSPAAERCSTRASI